ncbi:hypothetical protein DPMN_011657 [Dreissena polymorpha]|uniref:Uncharacterized protein n=1 Tax=Dreissena polymorpha TaxID=45954 RepID=A0A9D4S083_DREPO|nr:hypothetical protein DPMN_011657 [Dreissena polymorpha]
MVRQRPTRLVMGPCIVEIDRIVTREVQYQLEVNRCRNEEIIVKGNFGWAWPMWAGTPGLVMGPCIVEIDCIVIREVQYQFEVNRQFWWAWPMWAVQYQFEVNQCRNEEVIVKGNFGEPQAEIDHIVIRKVQYQFEVNRCRNEEIIVKGNFGWAWPMWVGRPRIDRIVIREVQYQFEDNRCRNEEIIFQGSSANIVGGDSGQDGRTDGRTAETTTISPRFSKSVGIKTILGGCGLLWAGRPRIDRIVINDVQYQFEVNRCRNEEIIVKGNFGRGLCGRGTPGLVMGPCIVEIDLSNRCRNKEIIVKGNFRWAWPMWAGRPRNDHIVIREVRYQFEVNQCRNEEIIVKGNFGWAWPMWAWPMWAGCPRIDRIVIREVQYQFKVNQCRNQEIIVKGNFGWAWPMWLGRPRIDRIVIREAQFQFEVNWCRNEEVNRPTIKWPQRIERSRVGSRDQKLPTIAVSNFENNLRISQSGQEIHNETITH